MERQGYTTHSCVEQEPCYRVHIDEGLRPRLGSLDYGNVDLVEIVDPVVAVPQIGLAEGVARRPAQVGLRLWLTRPTHTGMAL